MLRTNSLEQLLINYTNEKLHQHFLISVFDSERRLYESEGVPWPQDVSVPDSAELLALLESPPSGLLPMLDDQCALPAPSEAVSSNVEVPARRKRCCE